MDVRAALESITRGDVAPVYLMVGDQAFWGQRLIISLRRTWLGADDAEYQVLSGPTSWRDIGDMLAGGGLLAARRVIVLKEAQWPKKDESLARYLVDPVPDVVLVVWERKSQPTIERIFGPHRTVLLRMLPPDRFSIFLTEEAKARNLQITRAGLQALAALVAGDEFHAIHELEKMALFDRRRRWDQADVREFAVAGSQDSALWQLTDPVLMRDKAKSLAVLRRLLEEGKLPIVILVTLARTLGQLSRASSARRQGVLLEEFQEREGLKPYPAKKLWQASGRWDPRQLDEALNRAFRLDRAFKSGGGDPETWLTAFVALL